MSRRILCAVLGAGLFACAVSCTRGAREAAPGALATAPAPAPARLVDAAGDVASHRAAADGSSAAHCDDPNEPFVFVSPDRPVRGQPLRVVAITDRPLDAALALAPSGRDALAETRERKGGPPYVWVARVEAPSAGKWRVVFTKDEACGGGTLATREVTVGAGAAWIPKAPKTALWATHRAWSPSLENLYSAWVAHLFDAPLDAQPSWSALHDVLRDTARNFLFNHLGAAEDELGAVVRPDCADLPYFLRAYFAFKLALPFGFSRCSRGENGVAPRCSSFATNEDPFPPIDGKPQTLPAWADPDRPADGPWESNAKRFGEFLRTTLADAAQSGAGRTAAGDDESDYYPVRLSVDTLRPGTIFADPYGHVLVLAARIAQTPSAAGILFAVDGQPDGTVARKRFWRGNFLFAIDPALGGAGFKRFRPIFRDRASGQLRRATNAELADYSLDEQTVGGVDGFYDQVEDVLCPAPLDPLQALLETIQAFEEQVETRVISVDNGRKFLAAGKEPADMPDGEKIFETTGSWEDFSTPSRDLRLLIAIDVALPARVERRPDHFAMPIGKTAATVRDELEGRLARELRERKFTYTRTDGTNWELTLNDVAARMEAFEMAYNPNECVERRWGASPGTDEDSTCRAHAPDAQVEKMRVYREWFHERRRPPR
jgi:hypothetical protein